MPVIEPIRRLARLPLLMLLGLGLMAIGGVLDVAIHLALDPAEHAHEAFGGEHLAHLVGIAGMTVVLAGVVAHGARRQLRRRAASQGGLDTHAHR